MSFEGRFEFFNIQITILQSLVKKIGIKISISLENAFLTTHFLNIVRMIFILQ